MRVTCKFKFQKKFSFVTVQVSYFVTNCSSTDKWLRMFTNTVLKSWIFSAEENEIILEHYLKLDQRSKSIHYHCIMLWLSLALIIWADKFVSSKKYSFYNFHLDNQYHWYLLMVLENKHWLLFDNKHWLPKKKHLAKCTAFWGCRANHY